MGAHAECGECGEKDLRCLNQSRGRILCAECRLALAGKSRYENHHPAGMNNYDFVVPIPANEHAIMSDFQEDWPRETLMNPRGSILRKVAALLRAVADFAKRVNEICEEAAASLELLDEFLVEQIGKDWFQKFQAWLNDRSPR